MYTLYIHHTCTYTYMYIYIHVYTQVGNCVARRNYRYFYLFLNTICIVGVYMMAINVTVIVLGE